MSVRFTIDAVHFIGMKLPDAVPVDANELVHLLRVIRTTKRFHLRGPVIRELISDMNNNFISPAGLDKRAGIAAIYHLGQWFGVSIRRDLPLSAVDPACVYSHVNTDIFLAYFNKVFPSRSWGSQYLI